MEDNTLKALWKAQDEKLNRSLQLNLHLLQSIQTQKAQTKLDKLAKFKGLAIFLGIVWVAFLGLLIYGNALRNIYFTVSVGAIMLFSVYACAVYIKQIAVIKKLDYSDSITNTQKQLAQLQTSTINTTRILMLQMPFYATWFYTNELVMHDTTFQLISFPITIGLALLAIWLYKNITFNNMDKKWLRRFMNMGPEYSSVTKARDFLYEIEEFKKN